MIKLMIKNVITRKYISLMVFKIILVSESKKKLQKMLDKLNSSCLDYGMAINVKKTKVMVISKARKVKCSITYTT